MPTYGYKCETCGHDFEMFQSIKDDAIKECPECNGPVKRLIGMGAGIIFKGNGFYQTDYKKSCPKSENKPDSDSKSPGCSTCPHNNN
ncbi:MAG: FmdB family zinc ribbon protein [Candidatus Omnitrophota bacterium]